VEFRWLGDLGLVKLKRASAEGVRDQMSDEDLAVEAAQLGLWASRRDSYLCVLTGPHVVERVERYRLVVSARDNVVRCLRAHATDALVARLRREAGVDVVAFSDS